MASVGRPPKGKATPAPQNVITSPEERDAHSPIANTVTQSAARDDNAPVENTVTSSKVP
jgi:hypothetical protein